MLTKDDLQEVKSVVKEEVETAVAQISGAVIKALENTATKDDLKNFATKDDLKNFATKDDLKRVEFRLDKVESRLGGVEEDLGEVKTDLKIVKRGVEILQQTTPNRIEFKNHEKRITSLEKSAFPA